MLVTTREATRLTGLSTDQLREWTSRRALVPADVQRRGHGSAAQYSWQTILLIRIAASLRVRFRIELHAHRPVLADLRTALGRMSFVALWGRSVAIYDVSRWALLSAADESSRDVDAIVVRLDPHLTILSEGFALPHPRSPGQLELFPARSVSSALPVAPELAAENLLASRRRQRRA